MNQAEIFKAIEDLKFPNIQAYLRSKGWHRQDVGADDVSFFFKQTDRGRRDILLPLSREFGDFEYRIYDTLATIAESENKEINQVITDLMLPLADIVRFRSINHKTIAGTIPFLGGFQLLEAAKKSLFTAACDLIQPEKFHKRLGLKEAQSFIEQCHLGQSERGSYIASVICPIMNETKTGEQVKLNLFNSVEEMEVSFTRKVTKRLMSSLAIVKKSIYENEPEHIEQLQDEHQISSNFIDSLVELHYEEENSEIEISTTWSPFLTTPQDVPALVKISSEYNTALETIASHLRPKEEVAPAEYIGRISQSKAAAELDNRIEGEVTFNFMIDDEHVVKARVILPRAKYDEALEAHKKGQTVKITGKLTQSGRSTRTIEEPVFEVVE